jgi:alkylhydroperoxidase family enzyme
MKSGVSEQQVQGIEQFSRSVAFNEQEKAVLLFTEQLTQWIDVAPGVASAVREFLSESQYVTLAATVGLANFTNRFNHACGVELP